MSAPHRLRTRLLVLGAGVVVALIGSELAWRVFEPRSLTPARIVGKDGESVPLAQVSLYLGRSDPSLRAPSPSSVIAPNLALQFCYDGPPRPWFDGYGCVAVTTNSLGFRDTEFTAVKPAGEGRVLAIGDSFTFGNGVGLEDTWVQQLEEQLRAQLGSVQIVNAGFAAGDHQPGGYVEWLASDGLGLDPDLVIIGLCLNDLGDVPMALVPPPVERPWLFGASHLLTHLQQQRADRAYEKIDFPDARLLLELVPEPWIATQNGLRAIRDLCAERGVPLVVAVFPMLYRLEPGHYPYQGLHDAVADFCEAEQIRTVDTLPAFLGRDARSLWAHPTDQHPSPRGHALIAEALEPVVLEVLSAR